jgi:hypothetical protein
VKHITWQSPAAVERRHGVDLVGFDALGNRYEVESETSRGASWHTVYLMPRSGSFGGGVREAIGTRGTLGLVKALAEQTAAEIASPAVYRDAPRGPERSPGPRKGTRRNPSWWSAGQAWLEKKAQAEAGAQLRAHLKAGRAHSTFRYHPPEWQRRAIELLGANDEAGFKHLKLTEGMYDHAAKRNPARASVSTLTSGQIHALSREAAQAGDLEMCATCMRALQGSSAAKRAVAKAINAGRARREAS